MGSLGCIRRADVSVGLGQIWAVVEAHTGSRPGFEQGLFLLRIPGSWWSHVSVLMGEDR